MIPEILDYDVWVNFFTHCLELPDAQHPVDTKPLTPMLVDISSEPVSCAEFVQYLCQMVKGEGEEDARWCIKQMETPEVFECVAHIAAQCGYDTRSLRSDDTDGIQRFVNAATVAYPVIGYLIKELYERHSPHG